MDEDVDDEVVEEPQKEPEKVKSSGEDMIAMANKAAGRLEEANKKMETLIEQQTALSVEKTLGGKTEAGSSEPKEETPEEYAKRVMKGSDEKG